MVRIIDKIKVDIYGIRDQVLESKKKCGNGCGSNGGGCGHKAAGITIKRNDDEASSGCSCDSGNSAAKTTEELFEDLKVLLESSDVKDNIELRFYDLKKLNVLDYDQVRILTEEDFEPPFVIIDGIARYYGGISSAFIYGDIKELLE